MPRLCGAHGNLSRLKIAYFPHQNDIRIVAEDRTQPGGECEADLLPDLDLDHPVQLVFYRIFKRDDLAAFIIGLCEGGIEGWLSSRCPLGR